ncbi:acetyltransferase [Penicillium verhagenii]|nr:acetyltransferase [Penicillium verhagenii]
MGFTLRPINDKDITELTDRFSNFMLDGKAEGTHERLMEGSIESWLSDPTSSMVAAVKDVGAIVGWACWLRKIKEEAEGVKQPIPAKMTSIALDRENQSSTKANESAPVTADRLVAKSMPSQQTIPDTPTRVIGRQMREDLMRWESSSMQEAQYLVLQALVTSPDYQHQGVGSQLVKWGTELATVERLSCWCHASPAGNELYLKSGFQEVGRNEYELGEFGKYIFRYMVCRAG